jgi:hypothetical protein
MLGADIAVAGRIIADQDRREAGDEPVHGAQPGRGISDALAQFGGNRPAVDDRGFGHDTLAPFFTGPPTLIHGPPGHDRLIR